MTELNDVLGCGFYSSGEHNRSAVEAPELRSNYSGTRGSLRCGFGVR